MGGKLIICDASIFFAFAHNIFCILRVAFDNDPKRVKYVTRLCIDVSRVCTCNKLGFKTDSTGCNTSVECYVSYRMGRSYGKQCDHIRSIKITMVHVGMDVDRYHYNIRIIRYSSITHHAPPMT